MSRTMTVDSYLLDRHSKVIRDDKTAMLIYTNVNVKFHHLGKTLDVTPEQDCQTLLLAIRYLEDDAVVSELLNSQVTLEDHIDQKMNIRVFGIMGGVTVFALLYCFYVHETHTEPTALMDLVKALTSFASQVMN